MRNETRRKVNEFAANLARLNGVPGVNSEFTVAPANAQRVVAKLQESTDFLGLINVLPVSEMSGDKTGLDMVGSIAGRTDTHIAEREPADPSRLQSSRYECKKTDFDTAINYSKLDMWANLPDFQVRLRDSIIKRKALDTIMIGLNGTRAAADTNRNTYPLLQDVNIGWLQHIREQEPGRVVAEIAPTSGKVTVGPGGDYQNLDALAWDAYSLIDDEYKEPPFEHVVIVSHHLLSGRSAGFFERAGDAPTELVASELLASTKRLAGLRVMVVPFMPRKSLMITPLSNLSIYWQEGKDRRKVIDNPKRDQLENYESSNIAYVVEDFDLAVLVDNIDRLDVADWNNDEAFAWKT